MNQEECNEARKALDALFAMLPKGKLREAQKHYNELLVFIASAKTKPA